MSITVQAYFNFGRWVVECPKHGKNGATVVTRETTEYIAPCCYPGSIAQFVGVVKNRITTVPDTSARATARVQAQVNDEIYEVIFPAETDQILEIVSARPLQNQNWLPGETLEFLQAENDEHGVI